MLNLQNDDIRVSVHMLAYNHGRFIAQALDSVLMQRANFGYEVVVGEDCSADDTRSIALAYAARYPSRIRVIANEKNLGIWENDQRVIRACRGEYIAWLEADDYWISPYKLQKQVEFLDKHRECSACFHRARLSGTRRPATWRNGPPELRAMYTVDDLLTHGHFIPSCTVMFRGYLVREAMQWTSRTPFLEVPYCIKFSLNGTIGFIDEEMATFRYNSDGIYGKSSNIQNIQNAIKAHVLAGQNFNLTQFGSYRLGLATMYNNLSQELALNGHLFLAAVARCKSMWYRRTLPSPPLERCNYAGRER